LRRRIPFHPVVGVPRTTCPTTPDPSLYGIAAGTALVLLIVGYPPTVAVELPLTLLAGIRALVALNGAQVVSLMRRVISTNGPGATLNMGTFG